MNKVQKIEEYYCTECGHRFSTNITIDIETGAFVAESFQVHSESCSLHNPKGEFIQFPNKQELIK